MNLSLYSGNGVRAICSVSAILSADSDLNMIERPTIIFAYVEHSQYQEVWVDSDYAGFSGLWNSNSFRRLKTMELPKNVIAMAGKWARN